eukprot:1616234-Alexandrium_andersonii.AAC.1
MPSACVRPTIRDGCCPASVSSSSCCSNTSNTNGVSNIRNYDEPFRARRPDASSSVNSSAGVRPAGLT